MTLRSAVPGRSADDADRIHGAIVRLERAVAQRPGFGHTTSSSTTTVVDGLRCCSEEGDHRIDTDLPAALGGTGAGPTPGVLLRAALGSCMAMGYQLRAARHGVELRSIRVVIEADSAIEGMLVAGGAARPGFAQIRTLVEIQSDAPADVVRAIVDEADRLSPMVDAIGAANDVRRTVTIVEER
jgi:uncharacterized OsmC-like protein